MVLAQGPALQQHLPGRIEDKDAEGPMEKGVAVRLHFFHGANLLVLLVYENDLLHDRKILKNCLPSQERVQ
jgi:hypothetical protein